MKKYYTISFLAILVLLFIQIFYLINIYNDYCYRYIIDTEESVYKSIDKEIMNKSSIIDDINYNKPIRLIGISEMTKEYRDSILKHNPLQPMPKKYDINSLIKQEIIRNTAELSSQRIQDRYFNEGYPLNLVILDSIFIQNNNIKQHNFILYDSLSKSISQLNQTDTSLYKYKSKKFYIGLEIKQHIVLYYNIPLSGFIKSSIWGLIASIIAMLFIIYSITLQLSIIKKKQKDLQSIRDNINGTIHDLKSPLSSLAISIDLAKNMVESEQLKSIFNLNQIGIKNLVRSIDSILQINNNSYQCSLYEEDYNTLLESFNTIKADINILNPNKPHTIIIENKIDKNPTFFIDLYGIECVVRNLLENSLKYSNDNAIVKLTAEQENNFLKITIADNGWGIPDKYLKKVFKPYFRVPGNNKKGYGIGLAQVKKIIGSHNGEIYVESKINLGTTFTILIPNNEKTQ